MEYTIQPNVFTEVNDTNVILRYSGEGAQTVIIDEQGAILLPAITPSEEAGEALWQVQSGDVPVTRVDQPFDLAHPEWWPGGFTLVDGRWSKMA